jgi:NADH-quinone oxidoreductase subunit G
MGIADIELQNSILVIGSNVRKEQPIIAHRIRKAALAGATVNALNPRDFDLRLKMNENILAHPSAMVSELASIAAACGATRSSVDHLIKSAAPGESHKTIAGSLKDADQGLILLGQLAIQHPDYTILNELAAAIAESVDAVHSVLPAAGNTVGAWQAGIVPHRLPGGAEAGNAGKNISQMQSEPVAALIVHNLEPEHDFADPQAALNAANAADFCVVLSPYVGDHTKEYADVILPIVPYSETDGTFINMEGLAQSFSAAVKNYAESAPAWKVYRVLGEQLGIETYKYEELNEVTAEVLQIGQQQAAPTRVDYRLEAELTSDGLLRSGEVSIYATDSLVRRAAALQDTIDGRNRRLVVINSQTAEKAGVLNASHVLVTQDDQVVNMPLCIDDGMADDSIWLPLIPELGGLNTEVQIKAVS